MKNKTTLECKSCNHEKNTKGGICLVKKGLDGLPVMCVGDWVTDKYYYFERYLDLFVRAMTKSWGGNIFYIDLFCGPGKCLIRETGKEIDGSSLIALKYKFAKYIFVDVEKENIKTLRQRCKSRANFDRVEFISGDCNEEIESIKKLIPRHSLSLTLVDPFGLDFNFSCYQKLTKDRKVDLIINFPLGMAIKRNFSKFDSEKLDVFLGGKNWKRPAISNPTTHFIHYFKKNLAKIGYKIPKECELSGDVLVKTIKKKVPLYYLLLASKNPLGATFWKKIRKYDPSGQRSLF